MQCNAILFLLDHTSSFFWPLANIGIYEIEPISGLVTATKTNCVANPHIYPMSLKKRQFFGHIFLFYSTANQSTPAFQCPSTVTDTKQPCYTGGSKAGCGKRAVFDKLSSENFLPQCQKQGQSSLNSYLSKAII